MRLSAHYDEKRIFARLEVNTEVQFTLSDDMNTYRGQCRNLSHTGIQFDTEHALSKGKTINITVDTKNDKFDPMNAKVEVLRIEDHDKQYRVSGKILAFSRL